MPDLILQPNGAQAPAQQPASPLPPPNFNVAPDGVLITYVLAPGLNQQIVIPAAVMHELVKKWREVMRAEEGMRALALDVMRTKH